MPNVLPDYELQASACLLAADKHRETLLPSAIMLAGDEDAGRELFQEAVLRAHDTIQSNGFHGDGYQFYIWRIIKNLNREQKRLQSKQLPYAPRLQEQQDQILDEQQGDPVTMGRLHLADQIKFALSEKYSPADVTLFDLHVNGQSYREIETLTGRNYRTVGHKIKLMKQALFHMFSSSFEGLE